MIIGLFSLVFFPQMKTWMNYELITNDDGSTVYERPKKNFLAMLEWIIISSYFIYLTSFGFAIFTFAPPKINLFRDPIAGKYGIN